MGGVNWLYVFTIILPVVLVVLLTITVVAIFIYDVGAWICRTIRQWIWEWRLRN